MTEDALDQEALAIAARWCAKKGVDWNISRQLGRGGTAPVFGVASPIGDIALKIYDAKFSAGRQGELESLRIKQQLEIGEHDCPSLVQILDGGRFEDRLFLVMRQAPGVELAGCLAKVPRSRIRHIVDQVAKAVLYLRKIGVCHRDIKAANVYVSEDFEVVTLLDLSVTRDIHDPIGIGTDHNDQLPVVATARYSPPEYLFRLIEPGLTLWHALDIYQLGALLRDLITGNQLFEDEYNRSKENRYRFAWVVATTIPQADAPGADADLVLLAKRALDKDWNVRSALRVEDFLNNTTQQRINALRAFGLGTPEAPIGRAAAPIDLPALLRRFKRVTEVVDEVFTERLRALGVTAYHSVSRGSSDGEQLLRWQWRTSAFEQDTASEMQISYSALFRLTNAESGGAIASDLKLVSEGGARVLNAEATMKLPTMPLSASLEEAIVESLEAAIGELARRATKGRE